VLEAYGHSDAGLVRQNNEDSFLVAADVGLYLVADGMGGAQAGEKASRMASDVVLDVVRSSENRSPELLNQAFEEAHRRVQEAAAADSAKSGMGTTLVAVLECGDQLAVASVGDSRCYHYADGELLPVTVDQTWVQEVGRKLGMAEDQLRSHPMRHVLTMAIGASGALQVHSYSLPRRAGAQILLTSDGLHGVVAEEILSEALSSERTLRDKCHYLIGAAREAGGPDNITAVLLRVTEAA
jgi:protein phosphatase